MQARQKPLDVIPCSDLDSKTKSIKFQKPAPREEVKLVSSDNLDQLIEMLHNEAKVL
jgi:electron transfer flavoprotein beta subunit